MNGRGAVLLELGWNVFHVATRASATRRVANDFRWLAGRVDRKCSAPFAQRPKAFAATTISVPGTDDDSYSDHFEHRFWRFRLFL
jgi:hypothetical protein